MTQHETVPVDQRWLGMDRRGLPYAVVALVLIAVLHWVIPAIDDATAWDDPIVAGDVLDLGNGITVTPPVGWQLEDGILTSDEPTNPVDPTSPGGVRADLATGTAALSVTGAGWDGTANELMDQYNRLREDSDEDADRVFAITGDRSSVTTASGVTGIEESFTSAGGDGRAFAFVLDDDSGTPIGVVIAASATDEAFGPADAEIDDVVSSLTMTETSS